MNIYAYNLYSNKLERHCIVLIAANNSKEAYNYIHNSKRCSYYDSILFDKVINDITTTVTEPKIIYKMSWYD